MGGENIRTASCISPRAYPSAVKGEWSFVLMH